MSEKEYIITWLNKMVAKFEWITFRYEYSNVLLAHCIEVSPSESLEESEEYAASEYEFSCEFERKFGESVIFSDGTEFYKCSVNAEIFKHQIEWAKDDNFNIDFKDYILDFQYNIFNNVNLSYFGELSNYDLAA